MRTISNILWFIFGGLLGGLAWIFAGCIWCITIIGIPVGLQCFKFATLAFWPFGKEIVYGNGMFSFLVNLIWNALVATAPKRGTLDLIEAEDIREIFDEIESSLVMKTLWKTYQKNYSYAADISWQTIMKSICTLYGRILVNMYDA